MYIYIYIHIHRAYIYIYIYICTTEVISMSVYDATIVPQRQRNVLTCFNEKQKVQIKALKMETFSIHPPHLANPYFRNCDQHKSNSFV